MEGKLNMGTSQINKEELYQVMFGYKPAPEIFNCTSQEYNLFLDIAIRTGKDITAFIQNKPDIIFDGETYFLSDENIVAQDT